MPIIQKVPRNIGARIAKLESSWPFLAPSVRQLHGLSQRITPLEVDFATRDQVTLSYGITAIKQLAESGVIGPDCLLPDLMKMADLERLIEFGQFAKGTLGTKARPTRKLFINPTDRCNSACLHCHGDFHPKGDMLDFSLLERSEAHPFLSSMTKVDFGIAGDVFRTPLSSQHLFTPGLGRYFALLYSLGIKRYHLFSRGIRNGDHLAQRNFADVLGFAADHPDLRLTLRIGFNLFLPRDFEQGSNYRYQDLADEFLALLLPAQELPNVEIEIALSGSYQRSGGHILKAASVLRQILLSNGYVEDNYAVFLRILLKRLAEETGTKIDQSALAASTNPSVDNFMFHSYLPLIDPGLVEYIFDFYYHQIPRMKIESGEFPDGYPSLQISDFFSIEDKRNIRVMTGQVFSDGRYSELLANNRAGQIVTPNLSYDHSEEASLPRFCPFIIEPSFTLETQGTLSICGSHKRDWRPSFGAITEPSAILFEKEETVRSRAREAYRQHLRDILHGKFDSGLCYHPEWTS
ncbi:MAG: hypothetical protein WC890_04135 [Candidatus Margulisiibacteriota bacterium]